MRFVGICAICGGPAEPAYTCPMCGATVCPKHFSSEEGVCKKCLKRIKAGDAAAEGTDGMDGLANQSRL